MYKLLLTIIFLGGANVGFGALKILVDTSDKKTAEIISGSIQKVKIKNSAGSILVRKGAKSFIEARKIKFDPKDELQFALNERILEVTARPKSHHKFQVDLEVTVAQGVDVEIDLGGGSAEVSAMKDVTIQNGAGDIKMRQATGKTEIHLGAGNIDISYDRLCKETPVSMNVGAGNIKVSLPEVSQIRPSLQIAPLTVSVDSDFKPSQASDAPINISLGAGEISFRKKRN